MDAGSAAELAALMAPGDPQLAATFGATELAPRVAALCQLRAWVEQAQQAQQAQQDQGASQQLAPAAAAGLLMWRQLLALSGSDPELGAARYGPLGVVHRKKVSIDAALHGMSVSCCAALCTAARPAVVGPVWARNAGTHTYSACHPLLACS